MTKITHLILIGFLATFTIAGCSDNKESNGEDNAAEKKENKGDHVWKQQTDTLKTAKDMAKKMQESLNQQQQKMEKND